MPQSFNTATQLTRRLIFCRLINSGAIVWGLCATFYCTNAAVDFLPTLSLVAGCAVLSVCWLIYRIVSFIWPIDDESITRRWLSFACFPMAFATIVGFAFTDIGFCGRLWLCHGTVERFAMAVEPGPERNFPSAVPVGLFAVKEVDRHGDCVRMITAKDFLDDAGLAYCKLGRPPRIGEDSYRHLWGPWWYWHRSW